jgi:hypothetical protein
MRKLSLNDFFRKYVKDTKEKDFVENMFITLCNLTNEVFGLGLFISSKVYLNTRVLKHLYDVKPAEEFDSVLRNIVSIVRFPNHVYENKDSKRGGYAFVKEIDKVLNFCSLEVTNDEAGGVVQESIYVVTCFRLRKESYLNGYKLLWSWKGDIPSS